MGQSPPPWILSRGIRQAQNERNPRIMCKVERRATGIAWQPRPRAAVAGWIQPLRGGGQRGRARRPGCGQITLAN